MAKLLAYDLTPEEKARLADTTARQRQAGGPGTSAWVSANAGTGKTHVLVGRVARLLLAGTDPSRILCITFTKAAAAEMETRLFKQLGEWSLQDDAKLTRNLRELQGEEAAELNLPLARRLFARALETPGGLKIQTIHGFCQAVLKRFPVEAGIAPDFQVIDEVDADELQRDVREALYRAALSGEYKALTAAHNHIITFCDETQLEPLLKTFDFRKEHVERLMELNPGDQLWDRMWRHFGLSPGATNESVLAAGLSDDTVDVGGLRAVLPVLRGASAATSKKNADLIEQFLATPDRERVWQEYQKIFLKADGDPQKNVTHKGAEAAEETLRAEQARVLALVGRMKAAANATRSRAVLTYGAAYLRLYREAKDTRGVLDFGDLITAMRHLLRGGGDAWVHYKLDEGLDHILVDEAQDTSPEQWEIIELLATEMTAGLGAAEDQGRNRTIFAVGDVKQSIYRFQGAAPAEFVAKQKYFAAECASAGLPFAPVTLDLSFRSAAPVLRLVDEIFENEPLAAGGAPYSPHLTLSADMPGHVELWPPLTPEETAEENPWDAPVDTSTTKSPEAQLAARIADRIKGWLDTQETLRGANRPIRASDILILVQRRNAFMEHMIRMLKERGVPVAGADRLKVSHHIAALDLIALAQFALMPSDELTLAEVLKSPFVGFDEDALYDLAHGRKRNLWAELRAQAATHDHCRAAYDYLHDVTARADYMPPYEFFAAALFADGGKAKLLARLGPDADDAIEEFLNQALLYERQHVPALQGFVGAIAGDESDVKRDLEQGRNEVRVMTVHGAKGLESGIVFLPDTCRVPRNQIDSAFVESQPLGRDGEPEGVPLLLWPGSKPEDDPILRTAREAHFEAEAFEYRRLLYVALTRAKERLYICGWHGVRERPKDCWHALVEGAISRIGEEIEGPDGEMIWQLTHEGELPRLDKEDADDVEQKPLPAWARETARVEAPRLTLSPSSLGSEPAVFSPSGAMVLAAERGKLVHRLLECLPDVPPEKRNEAARMYLSAHGRMFSEADREELITETLHLMALPEVAELFSAKGRAEVALSGLVTIGGQKQRVEGRVDRLVIDGDEAWVLDYKTNRPPPADVKLVSKTYIRQMAGYRALLRQVYPRIKVRAALIWTYAPRFMELPQNLLDEEWRAISGETAGA